MRGAQPAQRAYPALVPPPPYFLGISKKTRRSMSRAETAEARRNVGAATVGQGLVSRAPGKEARKGPAASTTHCCPRGPAGPAESAAPRVAARCVPAVHNPKRRTARGSPNGRGQGGGPAGRLWTSGGRTPSPATSPPKRDRGCREAGGRAADQPGAGQHRPGPGRRARRARRADARRGFLEFSTAGRYAAPALCCAPFVRGAPQSPATGYG